MLDTSSFNLFAVLSGHYGEMFLKGVEVTLSLSSISCVFAFCLGLLIAVMRLSSLKIVRWVAISYLEFFRNTPLLVQLFFWYFGSNAILPAFINNWLISTNFEFIAATIALTIYTSAFIAEDLRSGILSIPKEQMEASRSSGFSYLQSMKYIILPQAIRLSVPPLINQFLNLTKNSSMAMAIGVAELTYQARQIESQSFRSFEAFFVATFIYIILSFLITGLINLYNLKILHKARGETG